MASAGGYCEAAERHWGKKGRLERGSKVLGTINHLEIGKRND